MTGLLRSQVLNGNLVDILFRHCYDNAWPRLRNIELSGGLANRDPATASRSLGNEEMWARKVDSQDALDTVADAALIERKKAGERRRAQYLQHPRPQKRD
jgi:hypothetical protein